MTAPGTSSSSSSFSTRSRCTRAAKASSPCSRTALEERLRVVVLGAAERGRPADGAFNRLRDIGRPASERRGRRQRAHDAMPDE